MNSRIPILFMFVALVTCADATDLKPFEATAMISGYCYAGSREDDKAFGGFALSDNAPKTISNETPGTAGQVTLIALPGDSSPFLGQYRGFRLLLINRTDSEVSFQASDSRLYLICEARDEKGDWKAIENLPGSSCGNSDHHVFLPGDHYWEFGVPVYSGTLKTRLRYKLMGGTETIYSNEFDGTINSHQFKQPQASNQ